MGKPDSSKWVASQSSLGIDSTTVSTATLVNDDKAYLCGVFSYRPKWLQRFANPRWYFLNYVIMGIISGACKTYLVGTLSTIEKRFQMSNSTTAFILIADNISPIPINVVAGYYANRISRPKLMSIGSFIVVLGCLFCIMPFFLYGPGVTDADLAFDAKEQKLHFCHNATLEPFSDTKCDGRSELTSWIPFLFFFIGNFLNGSGGSVYFVVGSTYMDDNIKKKNSPFYFSSTMALRLLGPVLGFLTSALCLSYNEDILNGPPKGLTGKDPRWIGAWWMGYIFFSIALTLIAIPMMLFPRILPMGKDQKANRVLKKKTGTGAAKDIWVSCVRLAKNPIFSLKCIGVVFVLIATAGYGTIFTKYLEHQFGKSASSASFLSGTSKVLTNMIGVMAGGLLIQLLKPSATKVAVYVAGVEAAYALGYIFLMFIGCQSNHIEGLNDPNSVLLKTMDLPNQAASALLNQCNSQCGCTVNDFSPVCLPSGVTMFSPCYAGCTAANFAPNGTVLSYENCGCTSNVTDFNESPAILPDIVTPGFCGPACTSLSLYLAIVIICQLIGSSGRCGSMLMYLRCVDPLDKSMALGAGYSFINLLAFIPYPIIYGYILDQSCVLWGKTCDGSKGSCKLYDIEKMRYTVHLATISFLAIAVTCYIVVVFYAHRIKHFYDEDDDDDAQNTEKGKSVNGNTEKVYNTNL